MTIGTVLLVEDNLIERTFLADNLTADGFEMLIARTLEEGLREVEYRSPDLVVVDLRLPDGTGLELVRRVRGAGSLGTRLDPALPLLMLTGCGSEFDVVRGFECGVDEYVVKPFSYIELRYRILALLRRAGERTHQGLLRVGELTLDPTAREVMLRGRRVRLAAKEFALLRTLASAPTRVFTKDELLRDVWGFRSEGSTRTLDSHACRLRQKLRREGDEFVINVWGIGYRLVDGPAA